MNKQIEIHVVLARFTCYRIFRLESSLAAPGLGGASTPGALGSVSGLGAEVLQAAQRSQEIKRDVPAGVDFIVKCLYVSLNE